MRGYDISNWQNGIDISAIDSDFVIMKITQGTHYVSPDFERQYQQAKESGKKLGAYHYAEGGDYEAEADYFIENLGDRIGEVLLALDWEGQDNPTFGDDDFNWTKGFCDYVYEKTGVKPVVYIQKSAMHSIDGIGYDLWVAQYPDYEPTGYQDEPWNEGAYECILRQYTSVGQHDGYDGNLDLDKFYGNESDWDKLAGVHIQDSEEDSADENNADESVSIDGSTLELAVRVKNDEFGVLEERREALGDRYNEVQDFINHIKFASAEELAEETNDGKYGDGYVRRVVLGDRWQEVQDIINGVGTDTEYYTVEPGDTLSDIAAKYDTTYQKIAELNDIENPNLIYPGTSLRVR